VHFVGLVTYLLTAWCRVLLDSSNSTPFSCLFKSNLLCQEKTSRNALMKYIINSQIYVSTTNIYWSI